MQFNCQNTTSRLELRNCNPYFGHFFNSGKRNQIAPLPATFIQKLKTTTQEKIDIQGSVGHVVFPRDALYLKIDFVRFPSSEYLLLFNT